MKVTEREVKLVPADSNAIGRGESKFETPVTELHLRTVAMQPWKLYRANRRYLSLTILFLITTSNYFDYYVVSIVLDPVKHEFGVSDTMLGLLSGFSFAALYAFAALPIASWADVGNRKYIAAITLTCWSVMTALCGFASTFWQLLIARLGVALTEPGAAPTAQSLVADYFPPSQRATALAVLVQGGSAAGYCVGIGVGGVLAGNFGWRSAFLWAGIPGVILAVGVLIGLDEPRERLGYPRHLRANESFRNGVAALCNKCSYLLTLGGLVGFQIFAYGTSVFLPSFMIRTLHATLVQVSVTWGFIVAVSMFSGALVGGWTADHLSRKDVRWYAWLPAIAFAVGAPMYCVTLSAKTLWSFIFIDFPTEFVLAIGYSVSFAALHSVCGNQRRAMATAIAYFLIMLIGCGCGPLIAGVISDSLSPRFGEESLRYALMILVVFLIPAALAFYGVGRTMAKDFVA